MNNSLLKDITYVKQIKNKIKSIKQQYVSKNYAHYENINEVPLDKIQFSINDQLFFLKFYLWRLGEKLYFMHHIRKNKRLIKRLSCYKK